MHKGRQAPNEPGYRDDWATPHQFVDAVAAMLGIDVFDIDVCARAETSKAQRYLGPDHEDPQYRDALKVFWWDIDTEYAWCNPPFPHKQVLAFAEKAIQEATEYGLRTAMLLPVTKMETKAAHVLLAGGHVEGMIWTRGRLAFEGQKANTTSSVVLIIGPNIGKRPPAQGWMVRLAGDWMGGWA